MRYRFKRILFDASRVWLPQLRHSGFGAKKKRKLKFLKLILVNKNMAEF